MILVQDVCDVFISLLIIISKVTMTMTLAIKSVQVLTFVIIHSSLTDALFKFAAVCLQGKAVRASSVVLLHDKTTSQ